MSAWIARDELLEQENELQLPGFDNADAWTLGSAMVDKARAQGLGVTIDIRHGQQHVFRYSFPGTSHDNDHWVDRKVKVVRRVGHSSLWVGQTCRDNDSTPEALWYFDATYAAHGGGFPIMVRGTGMVGVLTVSGLHQVDDHLFAVEALRTFLAGR